MSETPRLYQPRRTRTQLRLELAQKITAIRRRQLQRAQEAFQEGTLAVVTLEELEIQFLQAELHEAICQLDWEEEAV